MSVISRGIQMFLQMQQPPSPFPSGRLQIRELSYYITWQTPPPNNVLTKKGNQNVSPMESLADLFNTDCVHCLNSN